MSFHTVKRSVLGAVAVAALSVGISWSAGATLIGDTITITSQANVPLDVWSDNVVVGAGAELAGGDGSNHANTNQGQGFAALFAGDFIDVGANSIIINYAALGGTPFNYAFQTDFLNLDWQGIPGILTNVTLSDPGGTLIGSNISMITPNSFRFQGTVDLANGANFTLNLTTVHTPPPISEPATLPILAAGLIGLMASVRRKRTV